MSNLEEETYSTVFASLRHPIRRKILRTLSAGPQSFSDLQRTLGIESSHLTYHLEGLTSLLAKTERGEYALSSLGRIAVSTMKQVEEPPSTPLRTQFWPRFWRHERARVLALGMICIILSGGLIGVLAYHVSTMNDKNSTISLLNFQVAALQNQILLANSTINSLNSQTAELENQLASNNSTVVADNSTIENLQRQIINLQIQINGLSGKHSTGAISSVAPGGGEGSPPLTQGAPVYFSVEPVAVDPLINVNASINGLEVPSSPSALGQNFTVDIHLRNATVTNVPAGVAGVYVDFDFVNILNYCKPMGFTTMLGQSGGVLAGDLIYGLNGFFDVYGTSIDTANYAQATQYAVAAASTVGRNNDDGLVAKITFQITGQPLKVLNQSDFYGQLDITFAELIDNASQEIHYNVVQGTFQIDADPPAAGASSARADNSSGTIYIRADGSIDPPTAPISTIDSVTYTFTDNMINDSIVVERNNIVIDGAGHTLLGPGIASSSSDWKYGIDGIDLTGRSNVTVKDMNVMEFYDGICLSSSSHNFISGNNMTNGHCVDLEGSSYNVISGNNMTNNSGIDLLNGSSYNIISGNNITSNTSDTIGIFIESSSGNIINANNISGNNITSDDSFGFGIVLDSSSNNTIRGNTFFNDGFTVLDSYGNVVVDNVVNCKPLVYLEDVSNYSVGDAGQVVLVDCNRIKVENLTLSFTDIGLELWQTNNTSISGNTIANNTEMGINFEYSSNNSISDNTIAYNNQIGLWLADSSNNTIYLNNFVSNYFQVFCSGSGNVWDNGARGNYWSDYTGKDANNDGIGDTPYFINDNNKDRHPLTKIYDPPQGSVLGDLNNDGKVNLEDLAIFAKAYGSKPGDANWNPEADIKGDGVVDLSDLVILASHYGYQQS